MAVGGVSVWPFSPQQLQMSIENGGMFSISVGNSFHKITSENLLLNDLLIHKTFLSDNIEKTWLNK